MFHMKHNIGKFYKLVSRETFSYKLFLKQDDDFVI